jgi:hypothetical protein
MRILNRETNLIQNPALGAILLWRFAVGYGKGSNTQQPTPLPLFFIVLPIIMHEETAQFVTSTLEKSGLRTFADKFSNSANVKSDLLLAIHDRSLQMRELSMSSIRLGISSNLLLLDPGVGMAMPISETAPKSNIPSSIRPLLKGAEKLGVWCSAVSLYEISLILKVAF